jgi:hypothetical protein
MPHIVLLDTIKSASTRNNRALTRLRVDAGLLPKGRGLYRQKVRGVEEWTTPGMALGVQVVKDFCPLVLRLLVSMAWAESS